MSINNDTVRRVNHLMRKYHLEDHEALDVLNIQDMHSLNNSGAVAQYRMMKRDSASESAPNRRGLDSSVLYHALDPAGESVLRLATFEGEEPQQLSLAEMEEFGMHIEGIPSDAQA